MKLKQWIALALSAVLAVGMMTGCSSTVPNQSAMAVYKVNSALREAESEVKAKSVEGLNDAVKSAADYMVSRGVLDENTLLGYIAAERGYRSSSKYGAALVVSEAELEGGVSASRASEAIASQVGLSADGSVIGKLGALDTPEKVAAAVILGVDEGLKQYVGMPLVNIKNITYAVSGRKVTLASDQVYYLIVVEMDTSGQ